jgi:hypothetical protein
MLTGASFASTSEVWTSATLEWLKVQPWGYRHWHDLPTEFHKNLPVDSNVIGVQTDWWSHKPHFPFQGKQAK